VTATETLFRSVIVLRNWHVPVESQESMHDHYERGRVCLLTCLHNVRVYRQNDISKYIFPSSTLS